MKKPKYWWIGAGLMAGFFRSDFPVGLRALFSFRAGRLFRPVLGVCDRTRH